MEKKRDYEGIKKEKKKGGKKEKGEEPMAGLN